MHVVGVMRSLVDITFSYYSRFCFCIYFIYTPGGRGGRVQLWGVFLIIYKLGFTLINEGGGVLILKARCLLCILQHVVRRVIM